MTKTEIRKRLKAIVDDVEKDDDEWFSAWCAKYPEDGKKVEGRVSNIKAMKLGKAVAEMQYLILCLEYDTDTEKEEGYGKQAEDLRQIAGDAETDKTALCDLIDLDYIEEKELVVAHFEGGGKKEINVAMDSGIAMIKDIIRAIGG